MSNTTKSNSPTNGRHDIRKFHKDIETHSQDGSLKDNKTQDIISEESKEEVKIPSNTE